MSVSSYASRRALASSATPGAFDRSYNGGTSDAFVAKFDSGGAAAWSTFLGGANDDEIFAKVQELVDHDGTQLLMQGGIHPDLRIDWFEELFRQIKQRFPTVQALAEVREEEVCEEWAGLEAELALAVFLVVDLGSGDIGWQQVGRELDAAEIRLDILRQRLDRARLRQPGQAFDEKIAVCQQADDDAFNHGLLADDGCLHALPERLDLFACHGVYSARTSISGTPAEPDGGLMPMNADNVTATSTVCTRRSTVRAPSPMPANTIGTYVS